MEPVQEFVKLCLEAEGYFVRTDVRYVVPTPKGKVSSYSDLDLVAIRIDQATGRVTERLWGEVKAHLTLTLTSCYLRRFASSYATMLDLSNPELRLRREERAKFELRQRAAIRTAKRTLGPRYRRVLYFAGKRPTEQSLDKASAMLLPKVEVRLVQGLVPDFLNRLSTQEDNEPVVRIMNMLRVFGHLSADLEASRETE